jgi:hypothetical protein
MNGPLIAAGVVAIVAGLLIMLAVPNDIGIGGGVLFICAGVVAIFWGFQSVGGNTSKR